MAKASGTTRKKNAPTQRWRGIFRRAKDSVTKLR